MGGCCIAGTYNNRIAPLPLTTNRASQRSLLLELYARENGDVTMLRHISIVITALAVVFSPTSIASAANVTLRKLSVEETRSKIVGHVVIRRGGENEPFFRETFGKDGRYMISGTFSSGSTPYTISADGVCIGSIPATQCRYFYVSNSGRYYWRLRDKKDNGLVEVTIN